jgi:hypothetical protein
MMRTYNIYGELKNMDDDPGGNSTFLVLAEIRSC